MHIADDYEYAPAAAFAAAAFAAAASAGAVSTLHINGERRGTD